MDQNWDKPDNQGNNPDKWAIPEPKKEKRGGFFRSSFGSALLGGALVAVVGAVLLLTGAVKSSGGGTTTIQQTAAAPIAATSTEEGATSGASNGGNTVDEIYKADGNGVAFIESSIPAEESSEFNPFGESESQGGGTATGSGIVLDSQGHILTHNHRI